MMKCDNARAILALNHASNDVDLREHVAACAACAAYSRQQRSLDMALSHEMHWQAPAALTAQLLLLATGGAMALNARPQPKSWYVKLVYLLTLAVIGVSLAIAWQLTAALVAHTGLSAGLAQLLAEPDLVRAQLTRALPQTQYLIDFFGRVREQLMWLFLVAVLWAALDQWSPRFTVREQQLSQ